MLASRGETKSRAECGSAREHQTRVGSKAQEAVEARVFEFSAVPAPAAPLYDRSVQVSTPNWAAQRVLTFAVKTSADITDADVNHLLWLREQLGTALTDMAVITTGKHAYRRQDGVAVVPA